MPLSSSYFSYFNSFQLFSNNVNLTPVSLIFFLLILLVINVLKTATQKFKYVNTFLRYCSFVESRRFSLFGVWRRNLACAQKSMNNTYTHDL